MSASINIQQPSHSLYPIDELDPLLTPASQNSNTTTTPYTPVLFTVKDGLNQIHYVISMDAEFGRWKTQTGTIAPQSDSIGYQYYKINEEYLECRRDILYRRGISNNDSIPMATSFMNHRQLLRVNDKLGNIQFMFILWTLALIVAVIISIVYAVKHHLY